ncbi:manganese-dependent inorganic pyrophosphatase [Dolosicoccus paucivorans]|uniref:inorganic diphosphatase n=1 Tax=Dolosicoccus paucivorans TaxID=84521 RepID=A0A1G8J4K1_9LACT|nr:manganese-dependent inorganic pyrophosphatase [Dolosicoccus paucivorans]PMB84398.1 manganese-dependent inorganic pyrophosphatase [Dolosicoccus paucivorans]PMC59073.1 manganese-dependent inorganic pyrophosphatase [Dolosicoccus paucivorans]SDI25917.1 manganese-dependent inorganic pyrophosphatase [Dolosicoccus paucivorans]
MNKYLVFGHQNPDTDTIASAIVMSDYLTQLGHESEPVALGTPNDETQFMLNYFKLNAPRVVETVANETDRVALVDHNESQQSVADLKDVRVDYVVDHHKIGDFETAHPMYLRIEPVGCTATILYKMFNEKDLTISKEIAGAMVSAIISDTLLFKSPTCTQEDIDAAQALAKLADIDLEAYGLDFLRAGTNVASRSDSDILNADAKIFEMGPKTVRIGQVNVIGFDEILARKKDLVNLLEKERQDNNLVVSILVVTDILENDSIGFVVGDGAEGVQKAFDQSVVDNQFDLPGVVSRKTQIVPQLTEVFSQE